MIEQGRIPFMGGTLPPPPALFSSLDGMIESLGDVASNSTRDNAILEVLAGLSDTDRQAYLRSRRFLVVKK